MVARYAAGWFGDRRGHARLLVPGLAVSAVGMTILLAVGDPVALVAAMAVFGFGWNLAYDIGYGLGPLAYGAAVGATGHPAAFALTAVAMLVALRPAWRTRAVR